ncbi:MAG: thiamine phosphate synthase [Actinomycetota bacterium]
MDFANRRLYLCTPDRPDLAKFLQEVIAGGVDIVQLRDKEADAAVILERAAIALEICRQNGVPFILNDRPDLALSLDADGVHVGQDDAPPSLCRRVLGTEKVIGLSTHAPAELDRALEEDVTYLSAGPVEATPTKPGR